ncbi:MAG: glycosyltransferase [Prevotella sp.]|nr:glycosyltransferase [Candidatus Equicola stercoris]
MALALLIDKLRLSLLKRSGMGGKKKSHAWWTAKGYDCKPEVSFVLECHNKSLQILHVVEKLRNVPKSEIIVIDDGSSMEHSKRLFSSLTGANEFVIHANDLFEISTYDKAIRFANADYVVLMQDDDDFHTLDWVTKGLQLMRKYPRMVILGGKGARDLKFSDKGYDGSSDVIGDSGKDFRFVPTINRAPEWINKPLMLEKLKHIDQTFAPFQCDDYEMCCRAWLAGLQVGWYDASFFSLSPGGMRVYNNSFTTEQLQINGQKLFEMYADKMADIRNMVATSNSKLSRKAKF